MAMNKIKFQAGLSLHEFLRQYGTETQCEATLLALLQKIALARVNL